MQKYVKNKSKLPSDYPLLGRIVIKFIALIVNTAARIKGKRFDFEDYFRKLDEKEQQFLDSAIKTINGHDPKD